MAQNRTIGREAVADLTYKLRGDSKMPLKRRRFSLPGGPVNAGTIVKRRSFMTTHAIHTHHDSTLVAGQAVTLDALFADWTYVRIADSGGRHYLAPVGYCLFHGLSGSPRQDCALFVYITDPQLIASPLLARVAYDEYSIYVTPSKPRYGDVVHENRQFAVCGSRRHTLSHIQPILQTVLARNVWQQ